MAIPFPDINPVAVSIGPVDIRWYALAYLAGFILGLRYCLRLADKNEEKPTREQVDDFLTWAIVGVILGGRLGYVLFYLPEYYLQHPVEIIKIWHGGMSFHGGVLGVACAMFLFSRKYEIPILRLSDLVCAAAPIGLFFGRIANFINGELYGHVTTLPWGMVFPGAGDLPRHPSQLYEASLEGIVLFSILAFLVYKKDALQRPGIVSGTFLLCYGIFRALLELVREPDAYLGYFFGIISMGQILSIPMILAGIYLIASSPSKQKNDE